MNALILGMLAETFIHPGSGQTVGAVDLPVAREAATGYPFISGSSLKGALKEAACIAFGVTDTEDQRKNKVRDERINRLFGHQENAGDLLVGDARLALLPVRSLARSYRWLTCPHLLERFNRDTRRAGLADPLFDVPDMPEKGMALAADPPSTPLFLEERNFIVTAAPEPAVAAALSRLIADGEARKRLGRQLTILHDDDFEWFASYGLAVQARNQLNDLKTSQNLWYEETLPPDTVMYALLAERGKGALEVFPKELRYLQAGGNETVGQGWFAVSRLAAPAGKGAAS